MERLQKVLAHAGVASRRASEELITAGRVTVDGEIVVILGTRVDAARSIIKVDGERVRVRPPVYLLLNKPKGVVSTTAVVIAGETSATDLISEKFGRVYPVGRLDKDSDGLLLLTNDGELTAKLTHPRHEVPKVYHVECRGQVSADILAVLRSGVWLASGRARVESVRLVAGRKNQDSLLEITLTEGRNRQIRRMLARTGIKVRRLTRMMIGPLRLGGLRTGASRVVRPAELEALKAAAFGRRGGKEPQGVVAVARRGAPGPQVRREGEGRSSKRKKAVVSKQKVQKKKRLTRAEKIAASKLLASASAGGEAGLAATVRASAPTAAASAPTATGPAPVAQPPVAPLPGTAQGEAAAERVKSAERPVGPAGPVASGASEGGAGVPPKRARTESKPKKVAFDPKLVVFNWKTRKK